MVRKLLKFLHTMGAIGMIGAMASFVILIGLLPPADTALAEYASLRLAMDRIAGWILLPALGVAIVSGLFSMAAVRSYQNAGWAWLKLVSGVVMFEGTLLAVQGPIEAEAKLVTAVLAGQAEQAQLGATVAAEQSSLWVLLVVATANVVLGIWRPKMRRRHRGSAQGAEEKGEAATAAEFVE